MSLNRITLEIFAPILIIVGIAGFVIPAERLTSSATPYNLFHILFGVFGLLVFWSKSEAFAAYFNVGFGMIDLYQAIASYLSWPPKEYFLWTRLDDILHVIIGLALVIIGTYGILKSPKEMT
jgi:hypothetical protein